MIKLIINADDFGYSKVFNKKILELLERGFVRSTTVMVGRVNEEQTDQVKQLVKLKTAGKIGVGLHLELDEKAPVRAQIEAQLAKFSSTFGFAPSHLDIHKSISPDKWTRQVEAFAEEHKIPVRNFGTKVTAKRTTVPAFFSQLEGMNLDNVIEYLKGVKEGESCELVSHPGQYDPSSKSSLNKAREVDYKNIVKLQDFLRSRREIRVVSYLEL